MAGRPDAEGAAPAGGGGNSIGGTTIVFVVLEEKVVMVFMTNMGNAPIRGVPAKILGILLGESDKQSR